MPRYPFSELREEIRNVLPKWRHPKTPTSIHEIPLRDIAYLELVCKLMRLELGQYKKRSGEIPTSNWVLSFNGEELGVITYEVNKYLEGYVDSVVNEEGKSELYQNFFHRLITTIGKKDNRQ